MTKLFTKIRLKQISKFFAIFCAIFLSLNTVTLHFEAQAADLDSTTFEAAIDLPYYYGFSGCGSSLSIKDSINGGRLIGENLQGLNLDRYGTASCTATMAYNDPDNSFIVYLYKQTDEPLRPDDDITKSISDINNVGFDYVIDVTGNENTEEWGYRIDTGTPSGTTLTPTGVTIGSRGGYDFDSKTGCSGGECFFAVPYSIGPKGTSDYLIYGDNSTPGSAMCTNVSVAAPDCSFDLEAHINIAWETYFGVYGTTYPYVITVDLGPVAL